MASVPDVPSPFRSPTPSEQPWHWRLEDREGHEVTVTAELADQRFPNQGDAESWVGEVYTDLLEEGVDAVTLYELDRKVYGPMSLHVG